VIVSSAVLREYPPICTGTALLSGALEARRTRSSVALVIPGEDAAKFSGPEL
jgi:hypothetical protein